MRTALERLAQIQADIARRLPGAAAPLAWEIVKTYAEDDADDQSALR